MTFDGVLDERIAQDLNISKLFDFITARGLSCKTHTIPFLAHFSKIKDAKNVIIIYNQLLIKLALRYLHLAVTL